MTLYNAKSAPDGLRITKFTDDLEPEYTNGKPSSYIASGSGCDCPAGNRDTCRHRQMVPEFRAHQRINTPWFLDWDNHRWYYYHSETGQFLTHQPRPSWRRI